MKVFLDFLPVILFLIAYKFADKTREFLADILPEQNTAWIMEQSEFIIATIILIPATLIPIIYIKLSEKKWSKMHIGIFLLVLIMGMMTIFFDNPEFLKWKPTVMNWGFSAVFLGSMFIGKKNILQRLMGEQIELPDFAWTRLNLSWVIFFIISGVINLYVAYNYSEAFWVNFKLFGLFGITLVFMLLQGFYLSRHIKNLD